VRILVVSAAWFGYADLMSMLNATSDAPPTMEIIWGASAAAAAATSLVDAAMARRFGSLDELARYSSALRTGKLPNGIDPTLWRHWLRLSCKATTVTWLLACPFLGFAMLSADSSPSPQRSPALWTLGVITTGLVAVMHRRSTRIKRLGSAIDECRAVMPSKQVQAAPCAIQRMQDRWRENAQTSRAGRIARLLLPAMTLAFLVLLVADLDSIVYGESIASHLIWAGGLATVTGVIVTVIAFDDPRLTATDRTIESILQYDWAFCTGELPAAVDADQWRRWIRSHHRSYAILLVWACFYLAVGFWSLLSDPTGYHWVVAGLLGTFAMWMIRRWRCLSARLAWLEELVQRQAVRQLFG
jgi:hypothetical protein